MIAHRPLSLRRWLLALALLLSMLGTGGPLAPQDAAAAPGGTALGGIWAWGSDSNGQVGDTAATTGNQSIPVFLGATSSLVTTGIIDIAAGDRHSLALMADGRALTWGSDNKGQLGNGATVTADQPVPGAVVRVDGTGAITNLKAIAAGANHNLALLSDGTVVAWGSDSNGQLGRGDFIADQPSPIPVVGVGGTGVLRNVIAIAAGGAHSVALRSDGTVVAWGDDVFGQLGNGAGVTGNQPVPTVVAGVNGVGTLANIKAIAAGAAHTLALNDAGNVVAWGGDGNGQLGNGPNVTANQPAPTTVLTSGAKAIAAGEGHSLALKVDGTVVAWGWDANGQLGNGNASGGQSSPVPVVNIGGTSTLIGVKAIAAGARHSLALRSNGTIVAWGSDSSGQLGNGDAVTANQHAPRVVLKPGGRELTGITAIGAGGAHSLALQGGAAVATWGFDFTGRLCNGAGAAPFPDQAVRPVPQPVAALNAPRTIAVAAGQEHSLALQSDGTVLACGRNGHGELGNGAIAWEGQATPTRVLAVGGGRPLTDVIAIAAGQDFSLALLANGTVVAWGSDLDGRLGNGAAVTGNQPTPVQVSNSSGTGIISGIIAISAGGAHGFALKLNGHVLTWGEGGFGQLGNGTSTDRLAPGEVFQLNSNRTLDKVIAIAAGGGHSLALRSDGRVVAWGADFDGQLGDGPSPAGNQNRPTQVIGIEGSGLLTDVVAIAGGGPHSLALRDDGTIVAWGSDFFGQLGNGSAVTANQHAPVRVLGIGGGVLNGVIGISAGVYHSQALRSDSSAVAWGRDDFGQLGDNPALADMASPVLIAAKGIAALAPGSQASHCLALTR